MSSRTVAYLFRLLASWSVRRLVLFVLVVVALIAFVKAKEAYERVPALQEEIEALEAEESMLAAAAAEERARAQEAVAGIEGMELSLLHRRLAVIEPAIAGLRGRSASRARLALDVVRGDGGAVARELHAGFRLRLLEHEQGAIRARIEMIARGDRVGTLRGHIRALDARIAALDRDIAEIVRRNPLAARISTVPLVRELRGPWQELRRKRREIADARQQRANAIRAHQTAFGAFGRARAIHAEAKAAIAAAAAPGEELRKRIAERRAELSQHWATRAWEEVRPVLGWALWITILIVLGPPAIKAFWFFLVAPAAQGMRPIVVCPGRPGKAGWAADRIEGEGEASGSAVSRRIRLRPGEELLLRPDYLQTSSPGTIIDSQMLLSPSIPIGSLATGLVGLTRVRAGSKAASVTVSAPENLVDDVALIEIETGSALVFRPRNLVGLLHAADRPLRLERVWQLGHLSSWLTLRLRHIVFHGPCALVVKGARGVALEPALGGRRVAGAATLGWSAGLSCSVRRSETFLAYLTGKQSLFIDCFEGDGRIAYEELPRAGARAGLFGRGLEGLSDAMLKVVGL